MGGVVWNDNTMHDAFNDTSGGKDSDNKGSKPTMAVGVVKNLEDGFGKIRVMLVLEDETELSVIANPMDPNTFTLPLLNESVFIFSDAITKRYYYLSVINDSSKISYSSNKHVTILEDDEVPDEHLKVTGKDKRVITLGETLMQSRWGSSIRMGYIVEEGQQNDLMGEISGETEAWAEDGDKDSPVMIIRNGDVGIPNQDDSGRIILASNHYLTTDALAPKSHSDAPDQYLGSQVLIESGKLVFHSKESDLILSSVGAIGITTKEWSVDVSALMDQMDALVTAIQAMTHPTGVGPSGPPINVADFVKIQTELGKMKN
tara:strand:- start:477 stop:1427 length:951 start_codon:yes stop_codon:yes gene_type:complete